MRLVFTAASGPAVNASIVQTGNRFRMIVNEVDVQKPDRDLPRLPVARAVWLPTPDLATAAAAWIYAGGAHHTGFSQSLTMENLQDFADLANLELLCIDNRTEFVMFTLWESFDAVKAFAGEDYETAVFYSEDARFLIDGRVALLDMGALDGDVAAFLERKPGADGVGHKLSLLLLGFLATEVVPLADRLAELGIDPTPLFATTSGILRLYADTLERPDPRR